MTKINYSYIKTDLLKNPQKYQVSPYEVIEFIHSYKNSRKKILEILLKKNFKKQNIGDICLQINPKITDDYDFDNGFNELETEKLFSILLYFIKKNKKQKEIIKLLDIFLKKFEIKKRIFSSYDSNFEENNENYSHLINYLLLVVAFIVRFETTNNLKYLNVVLKLNDTLCSQYQFLNNKFENILLIHSLEKELLFVEDLCKQKGIEIL